MPDLFSPQYSPHIGVIVPSTDIMWGVVFSLPRTTIFISGNEILSSQPSTGRTFIEEKKGEGPRGQSSQGESVPPQSTMGKIGKGES